MNRIPILLFCAILSLSSIARAAYITEYDAVVLVKTFADSFLAPVNKEIAHKGNSTLFTEDVKGRVDVIGEINGRQLSTEYMFGLFAASSEHPEVPSVIGVPVAYNVTALAVQRDIVSASIIVELDYPLLSRRIPLELGAWFSISTNNQIAAFDITFHRFSSAIAALLPDLIGPMATWAQTPANMTDNLLILRSYLGKTICGTNLLTCSSQGQSQWSSIATCREYIKNATLGAFDRLGEDTLTCRAMHAALAPLNPGYHCAAMGQRSEVCTDRKYEDMVRSDHFTSGWLAPKVVTPENEDEIGDYQVVDGVPITPLLKISLNQDGLKSWDPTLFATATFVYMLFLWVNAKMIYLLYNRFSRTFKALPNETLKTNVVMYVMNIFYTFAAVALQAVAIPAFWKSYDLYQVLCVRSAAIIICGLYCFELIFRFDMRLPLVAHHFFTIFAVCFCVTMFEITQDMTFLLSGVIWLCQATTEQPTFIGLYMYRMARPSPFLAHLLRFAAAQTLLFKIASAVGVIVIWALHQRSFFRAVDVGWTAMVFTISVGLMATQVWGSWITWKLGDRVMSKYRKSLNRGLSSRRSGNADKPHGRKRTGPSSPIADTTSTAGYSHEFKVLMTPPLDSQTEDPYLARSGDDEMPSPPSSPGGSESSKRPIDKTSYHDSYSSFHPLPLGASHSEVNLIAPPMSIRRSGGSSANPFGSTTTLEPYGHSQAFGGERDSVWDLHAGGGSGLGSGSGSGASTPGSEKLSRAPSPARSVASSLHEPPSVNPGERDRRRSEAQMYRPRSSSGLRESVFSVSQDGGAERSTESTLRPHQMLRYTSDDQAQHLPHAGEGRGRPGHARLASF